MGNHIDLVDNNPQVYLGIQKLEDTPPFISLLVNNLLLHHCILDSSASAYVMPLEAMKELGLKFYRAYKNVCAMDSREVKVCGMVKDLQVRLHVLG